MKRSDGWKQRNVWSRAVVLGSALASLLALGTVAAQTPPPGADPMARLLQGFRLLDANRDGKLDRREFQGIVRFAPRLQQNPQAAAQLFAALDKDGDGSLTREEYRGLAQLRGGAPPAAGPPRPGLPAAPAREEPVPTAQDLQFFEQKIRPVLVERCYACHSAESGKPAAGLLVDSRAALRRGGDRGAAVVPGDPDASLLIKALRYTDSRIQMPPKKEGGKLSAAVIADFEKWVKQGAPDPRTGAPAAAARVWDTEKARQHWSFQPPKKSPAPAVNDARWPRSDIDRYLLAELEGKGLHPVGDADRRSLLRRVSFDLTGLPPTPEETAAFLADADPRAFERVVDRLLASPRFGERWGRHWLDVARYAESSGKEVNIAYPHAWRYRDYVIQAFNDDKPYDRFLKEQIAGDLLPYSDETAHAQQIVATGYLALGPKSHNTRDPRQFAVDLADEQIDAVTQGVLGLTVACARCHDHKFDPVSQKDYYALAGIFMSTETRYGTPRSIQNARATPLIELPTAARVAEAPPIPSFQLANMRQRYDAVLKEREEILAEARRTGQPPMGDPRLLRTIIIGSTLEGILSRYDDSGRQRRYAMGVQEGYFPRDASVLQRGELDKPQELAPRGFVQVLTSGTPPAIRTGSGRKELADWLASPSNPLTARVMANRVWLHLFGRGLVATPDNFGVMGQKPSHPALLDHLALSLVEDGWSVKKLIRKVVLSHAYQLSSEHQAAAYAADPDNIYLWRMSRRPLEAEALRDAMLAAAGKLDATVPAGSPVANSEGPVQQFMLGGPRGGLGLANSTEPNYRSVYLPIIRDQAPEALTVFDFAGTSLVTGSRESTTVPGQALYLMNSPAVQRLADGMALRLIQQVPNPEERVRVAFQLVFNRPPSAAEKSATKTFVEEFAAAEKSRFGDDAALKQAALSAFCQALFSSAEFRYLN